MLVISQFGDQGTYEQFASVFEWKSSDFWLKIKTLFVFLMKLLLFYKSRFGVGCLLLEF